MSQSKSKQTEGQKLQKKLTFECPLIAMDDPDIKEKAFAFCEDYKTFLNEGKTEREAVSYAEKLLIEAGYTLFDPSAAYQAGDKVYLVNREKSVIAVTFGKKPLSEGLRINAAHIDAPRLDIKPSPLYEKNDIAFFKTHYYGGIRKYQWATIPLSLHGVIYKKNGEKVTVFMPITVWGAAADTVVKFTRKGALVGVVGRITQRKYTNRNGVEVTSTEVSANQVEFLEPKNARGQDDMGFAPDQPAPGPSNQAKAKEESKNLDSIDIVDDDLPF